jgi:hypothetical protein
VSGEDPSQPPGLEVELREHRGDEAPTAELAGQRLVDREGGVRERERAAARVAVRPHRERREQRRFEAVAHGVEDGDVRA